VLGSSLVRLALFDGAPRLLWFTFSPTWAEKACAVCGLGARVAGHPWR